MNYAEDRLDRRARCDATGTADQLASDLGRAHAAIARRSPPRPTDEGGPSEIASLRERRAAHELAGKTLRDGGRNDLAVFHFGMAWRVCHRLEKEGDAGRDRGGDDADEAEREWRSAGDYAQSCELAGFPEIGALALFYYRAGGVLDLQFSGQGEGEGEGEGEGGHGCGCGLAECGASPCYVAFSRSSPVLNDILEALDALSITPHESFPGASDILAHLAHLTRKPVGDPVAAMHSFLCNKEVMREREVPSILQYWDDTGNASRNQSNADDPNEKQHGEQSSKIFERRVLPPVIQLLLLKLLYSQPVAGPFLHLACISMPYLASRFPTASSEGRRLARNYKSHWAYYVFIRLLILGVRVKKNRREKGRHHVPIWDVVFGLQLPLMERRKKPARDYKNGDESRISTYCHDILKACSTALTHPALICKNEISQSLFPWRRDNTSTSLPCIMLQKVPYTTHPPIFVVGDSHVLSIAWQTLRIDISKVAKSDQVLYRTVVPFPATGLKAWHARASTRFFTSYNFRASLKRIPPSSRRSIILSAGEIDCREGIGGSLLEGYYRNCSEAVERTVIEYANALASLAQEYELQILVLPVAPHAYRSEKNGKSVGRARRRETMCLWNDILRKELGNARQQMSTQQSNNFQSRFKYEGVFLLDYEKELQHPDPKSPVGYVLNPSYNADYTHVNNAVLPLVEDSIIDSGCDFQRL